MFAQQTCCIDKVCVFWQAIDFSRHKIKMDEVDEVGEVIFILWGAMYAHHKRSRSYK
jgi:hypothetical protein